MQPQMWDQSGNGQTGYGMQPQLQIPDSKPPGWWHEIIEHVYNTEYKKFVAQNTKKQGLFALLSYSIYFVYFIVAIVIVYGILLLLGVERADAYGT